MIITFWQFYNRNLVQHFDFYFFQLLIFLFSTQIFLNLGGELLPAEEEGGKTSSQYYFKYLSRLIMVKMYKKCTDAPFAPFLMIEMLTRCLA